jgi:hypothetical protein
MWKYLFKPYYSVFELLAITSIASVMISFNFWVGLILIPGTLIIQIIAIRMYSKQESIEQDSVV